MKKIEKKVIQKWQIYDCTVRFSFLVYIFFLFLIH